jgi:hypothetical protein
VMDDGSEKVITGCELLHLCGGETLEDRCKCVPQEPDETGSNAVPTVESAAVSVNLNLLLFSINVLYVINML